MAAHRYWRIRCITPQDGAGYFALAEIEMRIALGGADQCAGGTPSASSNFNAGTNPSSNCYDNNPATWWASANVVTPNTSWVAYDFGLGNEKDIIEVALTARDDVGYTQAPAGFFVEYSDDGVAWTTSWTEINFDPWTIGATKVFNTVWTPAAGARNSGLTVRSVSGDAPPPVRISNFPVRTVFNYPADAAQVSAITLRSLGESDNRGQVSQLVVRSIVRGHVENPRIRAWTFTLDGHDFYVLRLGDILTLVYDTYSEQWMDWQDFTHTYWRLNIGTTWNGAAKLANIYGSSVIAGDDTWGLLWFLDPNQPYDEHPDEESPEQILYFERVTMGQVPMRGRENLPCYAAWLTTDMGDPAYDGAGVTLEISDDGGVTFDDMGTIEITADANYPELAWYSLGQIEAPGRLFKLTDDGAITRIDGMEMNDPDDAK